MNSTEPHAGRRLFPYFLVGLAIFVAGPALYVFRFTNHDLSLPWYVPVSAAAGLLFMLRSFALSRGVVRAIVLAAFFMLGVLETYFIFVGSRVPAYAGLKVGERVPAFSAVRADGSAYTERELVDGSPAVLIFFRGRW